MVLKGEQVVPSKLKVEGTLTLEDDVTLTGDLAHTGDLTVTGGVTASGTVSAEQLTTTDDLTVTGLATVGETLGVTGAITGSGAIVKAGTNGALLSLQVAETNLTTDGGAGTETATGAVPAGAVVLAVVARVTTILAGSGLTTWSLGDGTDADLYGTGLALAADTTVDSSDWTASPLTHAWSASAGDLVLTAAAGQFDSGVVNLQVFYVKPTAPTS